MTSDSAVDSGTCDRNCTPGSARESLWSFARQPHLRPLPDVAMTGNCTRECTEFGHSDSCWMPGQPSPVRKVSNNAPMLSTFVPYQEMDGQEQLMANGSPKPLVMEERGGGGGASKVANMRFMTPYSSAYPGGGDSSVKDCGREEIPLSQASTPTGQTAKREIYL